MISIKTKELLLTRHLWIGCQTSKENRILSPSDYYIYIETCFNLQARLLEDSSPRAKFSTLRKYTFPFIEIKSFSTNLTYKSCSIEQIYYYFQLSSLARYFQAGRRKEVEGELHHKSFQDIDCKHDFQKTPQSHRHGFKTPSSLDFAHRYKPRSIVIISALFDHRRRQRIIHLYSV